MNYKTLSIQGIKYEDNGYGSVNVPVYLTSTFEHPSYGNLQKYNYSRAINPTREALELLVAKLEDAESCFAFSSGMAAESTIFNLFKSGDKILLNSHVYGGTYKYVSTLLKNQSIEYELIHDFNTLDISKLDDNVKAIFIESPSNPLLKVIDIKKVATEARKKGILTIVDNTFSTSYLQKPLDLGVDIVVYSATKYYGGHSDILAGLIALNNEELALKIKSIRGTLGNMLSPLECFLLIRGIKTLGLRMDCPG